MPSQLKFHRNAAGEIHCPVTFRVFTPHSHIVAVRTTGNTYSWDAVQRLNIPPRNWSVCVLCSGSRCSRVRVCALYCMREVLGNLASALYLCSVFVSEWVCE